MTRPVSDPQGWINDLSRRTTAASRRPRIGRASDLLGPGIAPQAVQIVDWSGELTDFNGLYFCDTGSLNSPDQTKKWIGTSLIDDVGNGLQDVTSYVDDYTLLAAWTPVRKVRAFVTPDGATRLFSPWRTV